MSSEFRERDELPEPRQDTPMDAEVDDGWGADADLKDTRSTIPSATEETPAPEIADASRRDERLDHHPAGSARDGWDVYHADLAVSEEPRREAETADQSIEEREQVAIDAGGEQHAHAVRSEIEQHGDSQVADARDPVGSVLSDTRQATNINTEMRDLPAAPGETAERATSNRMDLTDDVSAIELRPTYEPPTRAEHSIDYELVASTCQASGTLDTSAFAHSITAQWTADYLSVSGPHRELVEVQAGPFTYVYDATPSPGDNEPDNRLMGVYGRSAPTSEPRDNSYIAGFPSPQRDNARVMHRGHWIAHSIGGADAGLNLFPQVGAVNLGGQWRGLEIYCWKNSGTFLFIRPVYDDNSDHPAELEYGIVLPDGHVFVQQFNNRGAP